MFLKWGGQGCGSCPAHTAGRVNSKHAHTQTHTSNESHTCACPARAGRRDTLRVWPWGRQECTHKTATTQMLVQVAMTGSEPGYEGAGNAGTKPQSHNHLHAIAQCLHTCGHAALALLTHSSASCTTPTPTHVMDIRRAPKALHAPPLLPPPTCRTPNRLQLLLQV